VTPQPTPLSISAEHGVSSKGYMRILLFILLTIPAVSFAVESICFGTTSKGSLENGVKLPASGNNFTNYSRAAILAGRTFVHSEVRDIIVGAYKALESTYPDKVFKYAETGKRKGGIFKPHKTHQNGLSVDFMTPMKTKANKSVHLPTNVFNRLGYDIELDSKGEYKGLSIDYEALAAHIVELHKQAKASGHDLWRVILAPNLQPPLFETAHGQYLRENIQFTKKRSWVRHDEHYHIDFAVACE